MSSPTITNDSEFTVYDAAERFGKDPSHIRRLSITHNLGELKYGRVRILKSRDMTKLAKFFEEHGRNRNRDSEDSE